MTLCAVRVLCAVLCGALHCDVCGCVASGSDCGIVNDRWHSDTVLPIPNTHTHTAPSSPSSSSQARAA